MKTIIFDLDNTLVECGVYYQRTMDAAVLYLVTQTNLPTELVRGMVEHVDVAGTVLQDGFQRWRFPRACAAASYALDGLQGNPPDLERAQHVQKIAERVFDAPYTVYPGVERLLSQLRYTGWQIGILTKGDSEIQLRKVQPLIPYVDLVRVVPHKTAAEFDGMLSAMRATRELSWVVGDSLRDDVAEALKAGVQVVHVQNPTSAWAYESIAATPTMSVNSVAEMIPMFLFGAPSRRKRPVLTA